MLAHGFAHIVGLLTVEMLSPIVLVLATSVLHTVFSQSDSDALANVTSAFEQAQIVPNVLPTFNPTALVNLTFTDPTQSQGLNVTPGALLTTQETATEPQIILDAGNATDATAGSNQTFVIALIDPDAPTPQMPTNAQFLHFLGGDFQSDPSDGSLTNTSAALREFFPPSPPAGSDPHRYVLVVYNQPADFDSNGPSLINSTSSRSNFSLSGFANSTGLGDPIAGNYFLVGPASNSTANSSASSTVSSALPMTPIFTFTQPSASTSILSIPSTPSPVSTNSSPSPSSSSVAASGSAKVFVMNKWSLLVAAFAITWTVYVVA